MTERTLRLISSKSAADILGVSTRTFERLKAEARAGFPRPVKIDGRNYFEPSAIAAFKERVRMRRRKLHPLELLIEA